MKSRIAAFIAVLPAWALCFPPGSPMSEFGPSQVSLSVFFDHSGQDLFEEAYPSVLNGTGLSIDYAPWPYLQIGAFGGAAELDIGLPDSKAADTSVHAYNSDYSFFGGASAKLATPRFGSNTTRFVAFGSASYLQSEDALGNSKWPLMYDGGASVQVMLWEKLNLVLGGEFYAWQGDQKSANGKASTFGLSQPSGTMDYLRGLVGVEYFFKGRNRPFISVAFRPTGNIGWQDDLGLKNASISISLGAMATLAKPKSDAVEDEPVLGEQ